MRKIDILYKYLKDELSSLEYFKVRLLKIDNDGEGEININFLNSGIICIEIIKYDYDDDYKYKFTFDDYRTFDFQETHFESFFRRVKDFIKKHKEDDIYSKFPDRRPITEETEYYLANYAVFNKYYYNEFVKRMLKKDLKLYNICIKEMLSDEVKEEYSFIEQASKFDII